MSEVRDNAIDQNFDQLVEKRPFGKRLMSLIRRQPLGATGALTIIFLVFSGFWLWLQPKIRRSRRRRALAQGQQS